MAEITISVSGPVGCGKSALLGEIEVMLRAIGVPYRYESPAEAQSEKRMTGADWTAYLDMYQPSVVLVEDADPPALPPGAREAMRMAADALRLARPIMDDEAEVNAAIDALRPWVGEGD